MRKPGKGFSLQARLTLLLALAVLVVFGTAAKIVDWRADSEMQQRFDASLLARAESLAALTRVENGRIEVDAKNATAAVFPGDANTSWYEVRCGDIVVARTAAVPPFIASGPRPTFADARMTDSVTLRVVAFGFSPQTRDAGAAPANAPTCRLRYALNRDPLDDILGTLDFILLGSLFAACALVMLITPWLVRRGLAPLAVLDHTMASIGPDTPGSRLPATATIELRGLVTRFNEVLARMDGGLQRERQFASGLAHEFRTRLAELRALVDVEMHYPSGRDAYSLLSEIESIEKELEATVTALLQLTRIESGIAVSQPESVPLVALLARVSARHRSAAAARKLRLEDRVNGDEGLAITVDPVLLEIALDNLVGNAVAYAPGGSTITLSADAASVEVCNKAPTLQPEDLANFGQRFWRKGAQGAGHAGLGLALAGAAARALRMELSFTLAAGWLRATLHRPAPRP